MGRRRRDFAIANQTVQQTFADAQKGSGLPDNEKDTTTIVIVYRLLRVDFVVHLLLHAGYCPSCCDQVVTGTSGQTKEGPEPLRSSANAPGRHSQCDHPNGRVGHRKNVPYDPAT